MLHETCLGEKRLPPSPLITKMWLTEAQFESACFIVCSMGITEIKL